MEVATTAGFTVYCIIDQIFITVNYVKNNPMQWCMYTSTVLQYSFVFCTELQ